MHLASAITCKTIQHHDAEFEQLASLLSQTYPRTFSLLSPTESTGYNLVFKWLGTNPNLRPAILTAHQDVVPSDDDPTWLHGPFSGDIAEGFIWGRGSFDDKGALIAILEASEHLLSEGFVPQRTWIFAFGFDEETRGTEGACRIAASLQQQGIEPEFVLDEGGAVVKGFLAGTSQPIAVIGIAEKGNLNLELSCTKDGGHSSTPNHPTAVETICEAISRLSKAHMPYRLAIPAIRMLEELSELVPFPRSLLFAHPRAAAKLIVRSLAKNPVTRALVSTTHVATMIHGSEAANSISESASATVNCRLLPTETEESVTEWIKTVVKGLPISLRTIEYTPPSPVSEVGNTPWNAVCTAIETLFPGAKAAPYLMLGGTDAYWYSKLCDRVYRFSPMLMDKRELAGMHGINERLSLENLGRAIGFYTHLIRHV